MRQVTTLRAKRLPGQFMRAGFALIKRAFAPRAAIRATGRCTRRFLKWAVLPLGCLLLCFSTAYATGWVSKTQPDAPDAELCQALLYRLNHTSPRCTATAVAAYPGFKSPPWKTLDPSKHIALIAKLLYVSVPVSPGWGEALKQNPPPHWTQALKLAKGLVKEGYTLQIWRTRLLTRFNDNYKEQAPPGDQTIALLSTKAGSRAIPGCPASASFRWSRTFVVQPDLSGPDPRVSSGIASLLINNYPVLYKGRTLLINHSVGFINGKLYIGSKVILSDTTYVPDGTGCWFDYEVHGRNSGEK